VAAVGREAGCVGRESSAQATISAPAVRSVMKLRMRYFLKEVVIGTRVRLADLAGSRTIALSDFAQITARSLDASRCRHDL
jgi:hypothetical protein